MRKPQLALVVCGAPLAARTPDLAAAIVAAGWAVSVTATLAAAPWLDHDAIRLATGQSVRSEYRMPGQPKRGVRPEHLVICPATFNSVNKLAAGFSDNYALGVGCEALGSGVPVLMVPMVNDLLWGHPAWARSRAVLASSGVTELDARTGALGSGPVRSGTGAQVVEGFDVAWVVAALPSTGPDKSAGRTDVRGLTLGRPDHGPHGQNA